jgi:hypothetical protein
MFVFHAGVLYFVSCTVNPILYNLMSNRYRRAFRETLCRCRQVAAPSVVVSSGNADAHFLQHRPSQCCSNEFGRTDGIDWRSIANGHRNTTSAADNVANGWTPRHSATTSRATDIDDDTFPKDLIISEINEAKSGVAV